jgi:hypothetical protein
MPILGINYRGGLCSKQERAITLDGQLLICDIAVTTTTLIFSSNMSSLKRPAASINRPVVKQRKCGVCGHQLGHNRQKWLAAPAATANPAVNNDARPNAATAVAKAVPPSSRPPVLPTEENDINIEWGSVFYFVFDLETTGRSRQRDKIIEFAAVIVDESAVELEDAFFLTL